MLLGVDPGLSGAFSVYNPENNLILTSRIVPTLELRRNGKLKRSVDIHQLLQLTRDLAVQFPGLCAFVEFVSAMRGQGVSSVFSFGDTFGCTKTALAAAGIPYTFVTPGVWKKALGCTADKDQTLLRAGQLMPSSVHEWTPIRGVRDKEACKGIAEAALIALFGASKNLS